MLGVDRSALIGQLFTGFVLREDQDTFYKHRQRLLETEAPRSCELRLVKKNGHEFYARLECMLITNKGDLKQLRMTASDVSERKQAEDALRQSEEKYRLLFESAGDAIFIHDAEGRMLAINPIACKILGYAHAELMSMTIDHVDTPGEAQHAPDRIARLMAQGHLAFETVLQRKDGSPTPMEVSARLITWEGQPAVMSICRDITER